MASSSAEQIDDPQTLIGLFPPDSDDDDDDDSNEVRNGSNDDPHHNSSHNNNSSYCYEIQSIQLVGRMIQVRQYDYHSHNANRIWPGVFPLAEYLLARHPVSSSSSDATDNTSSKSGGTFVHQWGRILELGAATGLLAIRMAMESSENRNYNHNITDCNHEHDVALHLTDDKHCGPTTTNGSDCYCCTSIVTSDVDDEYGDVASNIQYNYSLNHMIENIPYHIPHTWGSGFHNSLQMVIDHENLTADETAGDVKTKNPSHCNHPLNVPFDTIIASDILLYVSSYPALVETLSELLIPPTVPATATNEEEVPQKQEEPSVRIDDFAGNPVFEISQQQDPDPDPPVSETSAAKGTMNLTTMVPTTDIAVTTIQKKFVMSWNRRLKESQEFFVRMQNAGFVYEHHGKGIYTFVYHSNNKS